MLEVQVSMLFTFEGICLCGLSGLKVVLLINQARRMVCVRQFSEWLAGNVVQKTHLKKVRRTITLLGRLRQLPAGCVVRIRRNSKTAGRKLPGAFPVRLASEAALSRGTGRRLRASHHPKVAVALAKYPQIRHHLLHCLEIVGAYNRHSSSFRVPSAS